LTVLLLLSTTAPSPALDSLSLHDALPIWRPGTGSHVQIVHTASLPQTDPATGGGPVSELSGLVPQARLDPVLGQVAGLVRVEGADAVHVPGHVTGQLHGRAEPGGHGGAVDIAQGHRHPGLSRDP